MVFCSLFFCKNSPSSMVSPMNSTFVIRETSQQITELKHKWMSDWTPENLSPESTWSEDILQFLYPTSGIQIISYFPVHLGVLLQKLILRCELCRNGFHDFIKIHIYWMLSLQPFIMVSSQKSNCVHLKFVKILAF